MVLTWREIGVLSDAANLDDCEDEDGGGRDDEETKTQLDVAAFA